MATVALPASGAYDRDRAAVRSWMVPFAVVVGFGYLLTDHGFETSRRAAFTQTAEEMTVEAQGGNTLRRLTFLSFAALGSVALLTPAASRFRAGFCGLTLAAYVAWCVASVVWSDDPGTTLRRCFVLVCFAFGAVGAARQLTGRELLKVVLVLTSCYLAYGLFAELALGTFRPHSGEYRFSGTLHPNTQGLNLAALCFSAAMLARDSRRRGLLWAAFGVAFFFLILTKSRTSAAGLLFALGLLWTLGTDLRVKAFAVLAGSWLGSAATLGVLFVGVDLAEEFGGVALMGREEQSESLTGRLPLWTELTRYVAARPVAGYGFDTFWTPKHIEEMTETQQWAIREAHNAYFETTLNTGFVGLGLLLAGVLSGWAAAGFRFVRTGQPLAGFVFAVTTFGLINACTESGMVMPIFVPFMLAAGLLKLSLFPDADGSRGVATPRLQGAIR